MKVGWKYLYIHNIRHTHSMLEPSSPTIHLEYQSTTTVYWVLALLAISSAATIISSRPLTAVHINISVTHGYSSYYHIMLISYTDSCVPINPHII